MYRPDRIGPWPLANLNKAIDIDTLTDFATSEETDPEVYSTVTMNTVSGDPFIREQRFYDDNTGPTLTNLKQVGIGVQITDTQEETHRFMYSVSGYITWDESADLLLEFCVGRLTAAAHATVAVTVPNAISLPCNISRIGGITTGYINTSFISTELDGGTPPSTFFDLAAFWRIYNFAGTDESLKGLSVSVGLHRYAADLLTYDPAR